MNGYRFPDASDDPGRDHSRAPPRPAYMRGVLLSSAEFKFRSVRPTMTLTESGTVTVSGPPGAGNDLSSHCENLLVQSKKMFNFGGGSKQSTSTWRYILFTRIIYWIVII